MPFRDHWSAGLGFLSTYFLYELAAAGLNGSNSKFGPKEPEEAIGVVIGEMSRTNVRDSLKTIGGLWDALITALKSAPTDVMSSEHKKSWLEADEWYHARRVHIDD